MMLGISLSLTNVAFNQAVISNSPETKIRTAIQSRKRLTANTNGKMIVIEPYALVRSNGTTFLNAVVIYADAKRVRKFKPQNFDLSSLNEIAVTEDTFFPNWAFNVDSIAGEVVVAIELVQYGENGPQANAGSLVA